MPEYVLDTALDQRRWQDLDAFTQGYVACAMWLMTGEDGESLDYLGLHDIADETLQAVRADCRAFQTAHADLLAHAGDDGQNGHDYFLTRNGHGAGFWDRGYPSAVGQGLTSAAHAMGTDDWYLAADGYVYRA